MTEPEITSVEVEPNGPNASTVRATAVYEMDIPGRGIVTFSAVATAEARWPESDYGEEMTAATQDAADEAVARAGEQARSAVAGYIRSEGDGSDAPPETERPAAATQQADDLNAYSHLETVKISATVGDDTYGPANLALELHHDGRAPRVLLNGAEVTLDPDHVRGMALSPLWHLTASLGKAAHEHQQHFAQSRAEREAAADTAQEQS